MDKTLAGIPGLRHLGARLLVLPASNDSGKIQLQDGKGRLGVRALVSTASLNAYGFKVLPSAYESALPAFRQRPVMLAYHDMSWPIGRWDQKQEITPDGLLLEGWISEAEPGIQTKVLDGTLAEASVTILPLAEQKIDGVRVFTKVQLFEASLVPLGADPRTLVEPTQRMTAVAPEPAVPRVVNHSQDQEVVAGTLHAAREALEAWGGIVQERARRSRRVAEAAEILSRGGER